MVGLDQLPPGAARGPAVAAPAVDAARRAHVHGHGHDPRPRRVGRRRARADGADRVASLPCALARQPERLLPLPRRLDQGKLPPAPLGERLELLHHAGEDAATTRLLASGVDALVLHERCWWCVPVLVVRMVVHELLVRWLDHSKQGKLKFIECLEAVPVYCRSESFKADVFLRHLFVRFRC